MFIQQSLLRDDVSSGRQSTVTPQLSPSSTTPPTPQPPADASNPGGELGDKPAPPFLPLGPLRAAEVGVHELPPSKEPLPVSESVHSFIPSEDPQRPVELEDEDINAEVSGNGIGEEDDEGDGEVDNDDEDDLAEANATQLDSGGKARHPRRPLPAWLLGPFEEKVIESQSENRDERGLPPLYSRQRTFWFPQPSTFFLLQRPNLTPQHLFNPRFLLWDPMALCDGIPCPNCQRKLQRHSHVSRPRRCVDANSTFWIIGYCYRCRSCTHPKTRKNTLTFRSWDSRILAMLPSALANEFPAHLSHRSGISHTLFNWVRSCFQNGMGAKQVSDALRVQHLLRYDELHLQYLDFLAVRRLDGWLGRKYGAFLPFDNTSPKGPHGFVPNSVWLRDMYDNYIETHRHDFNQHTAMLSAEICAIDHSHKVNRLRKPYGIYN